MKQNFFFLVIFSDGLRPNQKEILSLRAFLLLFVKQLIMKVIIESFSGVVVSGTDGLFSGRRLRLRFLCLSEVNHQCTNTEICKRLHILVIYALKVSSWHKEHLILFEFWVCTVLKIILKTHLLERLCSWSVLLYSRIMVWRMMSYRASSTTS